MFSQNYMYCYLRGHHSIQVKWSVHQDTDVSDPDLLFVKNSFKGIFVYLQSEEVEKLTSAKNKSNQPETAQPATGKEDEEREGEMVVEGERVVTAGVSRGEEASVHTVIENLDYTPGELDIEKLRYVNNYRCVAKCRCADNNTGVWTNTGM